MDKPIQYSKEFKVQAVKQYKEGLTPKEIFTLHGFDLAVIGNKIPSHSLSRWNKTYKKQGEQGLLEESRGKKSKGGGRPKILTFKDEKEKIKYLELQVAYLKAENDFLIKLRAQKKKE
jgi:transposase-like protein